MAAADVRVTNGQLRSFRSSPTVDRLFCPVCGSPIFFQRTNLPGCRGIFAGSLDDPNELRPNVQVCTTSAVSWLDTLGTVPSFAEKPDEMLKVAPVVDYDPPGRVSEPRQHGTHGGPRWFARSSGYHRQPVCLLGDGAPSPLVGSHLFANFDSRSVAYGRFGKGPGSALIHTQGHSSHDAASQNLS
jgi:hypothetical protein